MRLRAVALLLAAIATVSTSTPCPADALYQESVYGVTLNGEKASDNTIVLETPDHHFALSANDLEDWGVTLPTKAAPLIVDGKPYYRLEDLSGATATVDVATQTLIVRIPPALFEETTLNVPGTAQGPLSPTARGYYLNYDAHAEVGPGAASNLLLDAGTQLGQGVIDSEALAGQVSQFGALGVSNPQSLEVQRLSTQWRFDDINNNTTFTVGDSVTGESLFANQVHFAGIGYGRNFDTEPWLSYVPLPALAGTAAVPSLLQVYINNVLAYSQHVDQGPFRVTSLPNANGLGEVQMVLTNVQGQQQIVNSSYYTSNDLLAKGLSDFSYDAGFVNYNYGLASPYYGEFAATATQRYGFTNNLTGDGFAQFAAHDAALGAGANFTVADAGVLGLGAAATETRQGGGGELIADYDFLTPRFGVGLQGKFASRNFFLAGDLSGGYERQLLAHANVQSRKTSLAVSYGEGFTSNAYSNGSFAIPSPSLTLTPVFTRVSTFTARQLVGARNYIQLLASHTSGGVVSNTIQAAMVMILGAATEASTYVQSIDGAVGPGTSFSHSSSTLGAISYATQVLTGAQGYASATAQQVGAHGILTGTFSTGEGATGGAVDVAGALIDVNGHTFLTQPVQDSYGAVLVDGYPNVPITSTGRPIGATDRAGYAPLPVLTSYSSNPVTIDPSALPLGANVPESTIDARPRYRLPALVHFATQGAGGVVVHLVGVDGKAMLAGTVVRDPSGHDWPVGDGGVLYVGGIRSGKATFAATAGSVTCKFVVTVPSDTSRIPDLGEAVCR